MDVPNNQTTMTDSCYSRSGTGWLGSSNWLPDSLNLTDTAAAWSDSGYISGEKKDNPLMYDWNKVLLVYCDGGSFSGRNDKTVSVGGKELHFKGSYILDAIIDTLKTDYGLVDASDLVVSGGSAGGLATYLHTDRWKDSLPDSVFVAALPDAGFFLDWDSTHPATTARTYASVMRKNFKDFNAIGSVNQACVTAYESAGGDPAACFFAEHVVNFIKTPLFALQSVTDAWQVPNVLGDQVPEHVNKYRNALTSRLLAHFDSRSDRGGFFDSCYHHGGLWNKIGIDGVKMPDAFGHWYHAQRKAWEHRHVDSATKGGPFPLDKILPKKVSFNGSGTLDAPTPPGQGKCCYGGCGSNCHESGWCAQSQGNCQQCSGLWCKKDQTVWWQAQKYPCSNCCGTGSGNAAANAIADEHMYHYPPVGPRSVIV